MEDNNLLNVYDEICTVTAINLFSFSKDKDYVLLKNFNPKSEEHLFMWYTAMNVAATLNKNIAVNLSKWKRFWLQIKFSRRFGKKKLGWLVYANDEDMPTCDEILDTERKYASEISKKPIFMFNEIYETYYAHEDRR